MTVSVTGSSCCWQVGHASLLRVFSVEDDGVDVGGHQRVTSMGKRQGLCGSSGVLVAQQQLAATTSVGRAEDVASLGHLRPRVPETHI